MRITGNIVARAIGLFTLGLLAFIHLVLPFTSANSHPEAHIRVAAVVIGLAFLALLALARVRPRRALAVGLLFFVAVSGVAASTGRSPVQEGLPVKIVLALGLGVGLASTHRGAAPKLDDETAR